MLVLTQEEFNDLFKVYPQVRKARAGEPCCPYCSNAFSPSNLIYYNQATEEGTPCCTVEISCDICAKAVWRGGSWWPGIDDTEELIQEAQKMLDGELTRQGEGYGLSTTD